MFYIFAYGSLLFEPELPEECLVSQVALLRGYRRAFNKESWARACPRKDAFDAFPDVPDRFRRKGKNLSLALGTVADPTTSMVGVALGYPDAVREGLLERLDRREGYRLGRPAAENGYLRECVPLHGLDGGALPDATTYLSNPDPDGRFFVGEDVPLTTKAKVLINATPRLCADGHKRRGLHYLEGTRAALREAGAVDQQLEAIAGAIRSFPGLWVSCVYPET